jgi:hypothetical protein
MSGSQGQEWLAYYEQFVYFSSDNVRFAIQATSENASRVSIGGLF